MKSLLVALGLSLAACSTDPTTTSQCGNGKVEASEVCDDGVDNGKPGHCSADCAVKPALGRIEGDVLPFMSEVDGVRVAGAKITVLERPDLTFTTGDDGHFRFDGLAPGSEATLVMEHPTFHVTQTPTFVVGQLGIDPFTLQAVPTSLFTALSSVIGTPLQEDKYCIIASTVTRFGGSLYAHLRQGEPDATVTLSPPVPASSGPIYFNENVIPDKTITATSKDGGVVFINVPPGEYTMTATKPNVVFRPIKLKCTAGMIVNGGPPLGVQAHVADPDLAGGLTYGDDGYSASTDALCDATASCVNAKAGKTNVPPITTASCKKMFKGAWSYVDAACDADGAFRGAAKTLFSCRAASCDLTLGDDTACAAEDQAFVTAMGQYGACFAQRHP